MADPVSAVAEAAATGETAEIFADIRCVLGVDVVNLIWRHLATIDGVLPWAWGALRPLYQDDTIATEAEALYSDLDLPALPNVPEEAFLALGLDATDVGLIRNVLAAYDRTNSRALIAFLGLLTALDAETGLSSAAPPQDGVDLHPWRESPEQISQALRHMRAFLGAHQPVTASAKSITSR